MNLVIVESPAKAKTINKYLGSDYKVVASFGHIRDLPSKAGSVLPEDDFAVKYEISAKSAKHVTEIVKLAKNADKIILATDPDREGEAISWHIAEMLAEKKIKKSESSFQRVAFNEITKKSVLNAIANPRTIDMNLVNAQQARRVLDYLVGFNLSPVLWRKLPGCKSAGRVQSVALRLVSDREDEIERFISQEYWDITTIHQSDNNNDVKEFSAKLTHIDDQKLEKFSITNAEQAHKISAELNGLTFSVHKITKKQQKRNPPPPFITSSLQQEASRKFGFSAKRTMQIAQKLYEGIDINGETIGLITYMRTDGVNLSDDAVKAVRQQISDDFGSEYLPSSPRIYKSKAKNAQEAHEAIRPTNISLKPANISKNLTDEQQKLYQLIWSRTMACQMESVIVNMVAADLITSNNKFVTRATGTSIAFDGYYKIYAESNDDEKAEQDKMLPILSEGQAVITNKISPNQHFTEPPPRYSEASLVKKLEELGIGRPSTYATIISVLQDRGYATIEKKRFHPSELGRLLTTFLSKYFSKYVEYDFTAKLEEDLDEISDGKIAWKKLMHSFWLGFDENVKNVSEYKISDIINYIQENLDFHLFGDPQDPNYNKKKKCPSCSNGTLSLKLGKYGAFLACANYPECNYNQPVTKTENPMQINENIIDEGPKTLGEMDGKNIYLKKGPYGHYIQLGEDGKGKDKPKRSTIPADIKLEEVNLEVAKKLLILPLTIGQHSQTGEEMVMGIGKFGPYIKYQNKFTSIPKSYDHYSLTIEQAEQILADKYKKKDN